LRARKRKKKMKKRIFVILAFFMSVSTFAQTSQNYKDMHDALIRFYGYQRSGLKSGTTGNLNNLTIHQGDSYKGHQLDGGWNDAGDYIKFGMPLASTVYCLLKGYDIFPSAYSDNYKADNSSGANSIPDVLDQVKFATDYIMKAVIDESTIILDCGMASEHATMDATPPNAAGRGDGDMVLCDGADVPAVYAAGLACMAVVYKKFDSTYSAQCIAKAVQAYNFSKNKIGQNKLFCTPQKDHANGDKPLYDYYSDAKGKKMVIEDKMGAAGVELYRATNNPIYKTWAKTPIPDYYNNMGYCYIGPLTSIEQWRQNLGNTSSILANASFCSKMMQTTGLFTGIYKNSSWGTARDAGAAAFGFALNYIVSSTQSQRDTLLQRVKNHVGWVTGYYGATKKQSYVVAVNGGPTGGIHYRPTSKGPNGGVLSGPDGDGNWKNDGSAQYDEPAIDYNSALVGAVAFLKALDNSGDDIKMSSAFSVSPSTNVNFTSQTVKLSATFSKSTKWTILISGGNGSKTFTNTGTTINETWDGKADKGFFLSGETVTAQLSIDGTIVVYDLIKALAQTVIISKATKLPPSSADVKIDDFEDKDTANKVGGGWSPFGTATSFANKTSIDIVKEDSSNALGITGSVLTNDNANNAGVRCTFNAAGAPASIGASKTVVFDLKGTSDVAMVRVELEQPSITDKAYYGKYVPITTLSNTYRISIADFTQADWKTGDKPLDLNNISALRFTWYDSTGRMSLYLDNVSIENFNHSNSVLAFNRLGQSSFKPVIANGSLRYTMPSVSALDLSICDVVGRTVLKRTVQAAPGEEFSIPLSRLPAGTYTVMHSVNGVAMGKNVRFTQVR
jgi:hypothetical protein